MYEQDAPSAMLEAALAYAARGWPVFPCNGKKPRTMHGFKEATTDAEKIRDWWLTWPQADIGIPTGRASGLFVLDVDVKHGVPGKESIDDLEREHGMLPLTPHQTTPNGGDHYLFQYPTNKEIRNSTSDVGDGIDIRGEGGYFIAAPSKGAFGGEYVWDAGAHPDDLEPASASAWLLSMVVTRQDEAPVRTASHDRSHISLAAKEFVAFGAPMNKQRDTALVVARSLLNDSGFTVEEVADCVWRGFQASPNDPEDPWTYQDAYGMAADLAASPAPPRKPLVGGSLIVDTGTQNGSALSVAHVSGVLSEGNRLHFRTGVDIANETSAEVPWVAKPYFASGSITELTAKIKLGKSTLLLAAARAILDGAELLGERTTQCPVVYLTEQQQTSFRAAVKRAGLLDREDFHVLYWHDTIGRSWPDVMRETIAHCQEVGAGILFVDTLAQFAGLRGDAENNAGDALGALQPLQEAAASGLAVVICRHERKSGGDVGDAGRGSSAYGGGVDVMLSLKRAEGQGRATVRVLHGLGRFEETPQTLVIDLTEDGYASMGTEAAVGSALIRSALLQHAPSNEGDALKEVDLLALLPKELGSRTAKYEVLIALMAENLISRRGAGKKGDAFHYWRVG